MLADELHRDFAAALGGVQDRLLRRVGVEDRAAEPQLHGELRLRAQRAEPAQHRQRLRERAPRRVHDLHGADQPRGPRPAALADRRLRAGQLAGEARLTLDYGVRLTHSGGYYDTRKSTAGFYEPAGIAARRRGCTGRSCTTPVPGNQTCPANNQRAYDPANPAVCSRARSSATWCRARVADQRHGRRRLPRHAAGRVLQLHPARGGAAGRLRVGHQRRRQAGAAGVERDLLRDPHTRRTGKTSSATRRRRSTAWSSGRRFGDIENFATSNIDVRRDADQRAVRRRRDSARSRSPTT